MTKSNKNQEGPHLQGQAKLFITYAWLHISKTETFWDKEFILYFAM